MHQYIAQVLSVILASLEDPDESVQLTAVQCLLTVSSLYSYNIISFFSTDNKQMDCFSMIACHMKIHAGAEIIS